MADFIADWRPGSERIAEDMAAYRGSYIDALTYRAPRSLEFQTFVFLVWGLWRSGGVMLIGMGLHKLGLFDAKRRRSLYATLVVVGLLVGIPMVIYGLYQNFERDWAMEYSFFIGSQYNYWASLLVGLGWVGMIMLICRSPKVAWRSPTTSCKRSYARPYSTVMDWVFMVGSITRGRY
jgi:uncharacterized protein